MLLESSNSMGLDLERVLSGHTASISSDFNNASFGSHHQAQQSQRVAPQGRFSAGTSPTAATVKRRERADTNGSLRLDDVLPCWLEFGAGDRYLLLEDAETGDVLMPLIYMKAVFEANYSRKLSSSRHRVVVAAPGTCLAQRGAGTLFWQWAFESPHNVKVIVRKELGEDNTPQGHLRLVLLPVVYNAMAAKPELRATPLWAALESAMRASTYWPLLRHPDPRPPTPSHPESAAAAAAAAAADAVARLLPPDSPVASEAGAGNYRGRLFAGTPCIGSGGSVAGRPLFHGPRDLEATAGKYMYCCASKEDNDIGAKRPRNVYSSSQEMNGLAPALAATSSASDLALPNGAAQPTHEGFEPNPSPGASADAAGLAALRAEFDAHRAATAAQLGVLGDELAIVKNCVMQLYHVLLPGKLPGNGGQVLSTGGGWGCHAPPSQEQPHFFDSNKAENGCGGAELGPGSPLDPFGGSGGGGGLAGGRAASPASCNTGAMRHAPLRAALHLHQQVEGGNARNHLGPAPQLLGGYGGGEGLGPGLYGGPHQGSAPAHHSFSRSLPTLHIPTLPGGALSPALPQLGCDANFHGGRGASLPHAGLSGLTEPDCYLAGGTAALGAHMQALSTSSPAPGPAALRAAAAGFSPSLQQLLLSQMARSA